VRICIQSSQKVLIRVKKIFPKNSIWVTESYADFKFNEKVWTKDSYKKVISKNLTEKNALFSLLIMFMFLGHISNFLNFEVKCAQK
jgi:nitrate reductase gamma subunit